MQKIYNKLMYLLLAFTSNIVMAQSNVFEPSKDDVMIKIIGQLFGGLMPNGGKDAFGDAISTFNGAVLMVGAILACYSIISSTINTAHDGEMLGKKFSSAWMPIRYALGTALIIPVVGGYAGIQKLMLWVIIQGIALGGMLWGAYMEKPYQQANTTIQQTTKYDVQNLAEKVFLSQICVQANQTSVKRADNILDIFKSYNYAVDFDAEKNTYNFGDQNGSILGAGADACGSVKLSDPIANQTVATGPATTNYGYLGPLDDLFSPADISPINKAHETATKQLITSMGALATEALNSHKIDNAQAKAYYKKILTASDAYITTIKASADAVQNQKAVSDKAKDYGFAMAGSYFMNIITTNNKITSAIANTPVASPKYHTRSEDVDADISIGAKIVATGNSAYGSGAQASAKQADQKDIDMSWDAKLVNTITKYFTHLDFYNLKNDARHPIIILADMGNTLQDAYVHLVMAVLGLAVGGGIIGGIVGIVSPVGAVITSTIGNGLATIFGFLALPLLMLIGSAFTASYLIPMMVFISWIGILVGYCISVVMAIIVSPLWIAFHLTPDGNDLAGRGANGYLMVVHLLLKPAFTIFGLISAIVLSSVLGEFINKIYFQTFSYSQGDAMGLMTFFKTSFGVAIYIGLMFMFIKKCFGLIGDLPDMLFKWIGGSGGNLSGHASQMQQGSASAFQQTAGFLGAKSLHDGIQNAGKKFSEMVKDGAVNKLKGKGNGDTPPSDPTDPRQRFGKGREQADGTYTPRQSYSDFKNGNAQPGTTPGTDTTDAGIASTGAEQSINETPRDSGARQQEQSLTDSQSSSHGSTATADSTHPSFSDIAVSRTEMATPDAVAPTDTTGSTIKSDAGSGSTNANAQVLGAIAEPTKAPEIKSNASFNDVSVAKQQEQAKPTDDTFKGE